MSTTFQVYGTNATSTSLSNSCTLVTETVAAGTRRQTTTATNSSYGQAASQAGSSRPASTQATIGAPDGNGWHYDTTALEGQQIVSGTWTAKLQLTENNNNDFIGNL